MSGHKERDPGVGSARGLGESINYGQRRVYHRGGSARCSSTVVKRAVAAATTRVQGLRQADEPTRGVDTPRRRHDHAVAPRRAPQSRAAVRTVLGARASPATGARAMTPVNKTRASGPQNKPTTPTKPTSPGGQLKGEVLAFTLYTATVPDRIAKAFGIDAAGGLTKATRATFARGRAQRVSAANLHELAAKLNALTGAQAVGWGVCLVGDDVGIVPERDAVKGNTTATARTRANFRFAHGPGVMMLDHDGAPDQPLDRDALRDALIGAVPVLAEAPMLWRLSASAGLVGPDGREMSGKHRHRLYIPVTNASMILDAGKRLEELLWAAGHGWYEVGAAGQALKRCLVDSSVWQPERLDFAGPPILNDGIRRPDGAEYHVYGDAAARFDLRALTDLPSAAKAAAERQTAARAAVKKQCAEQRERWAAERAPALATRRGIRTEQAHALLVRASGAQVLTGDFELVTQAGDVVTVGAVLDAPTRWHNERFADPLGSYPEDRRIAVVNLRSGGRSYLYTHGHGGMRFELLRQSSRIRVGRGRRVEATDAVLDALRGRGELFEFGEGAVAYIADARARTVSSDWLLDHLGRACEFYSVLGGGGEVVERAEDAPKDVAHAVLAKHGQRGFKRLAGVITAPTLRADGSVLDEPGYDEASGLLYFNASGDVPRVPSDPTPAYALDALRVLWEPFELFPLADDVSRGVVLHGLLTSCIRAALPTAPGVALDAPAAGTGKTLLAKCMGILATGTEPSILPPTETDDETRKRLFAALRDGARTLLWDNVREPLGCAALDSFLTAPMFADRVLGSSETIALPNKALFIATGNNLRLTGDTCRRVLVARLDAQIDQPYAREFDSDPASRCVTDRAALVVAALTIVRAYVVAGRPRCGSGRMASFEQWDDLVRQSILWVNRVACEKGAELPRFGDPMQSAARAFEHDADSIKLTALLTAWRGAFDDAPRTIAAAVTHAALSGGTLHAALDEIGGQGAKINPRILGRWIERHVGRRIDGARFEKGRLSSGLQTWLVKADKADKADRPTTRCVVTDGGPPGNGFSGFGGCSGFVLGSGRAGVGAAGDVL